MSDFTFTFHFHALEKEMATHSSVLAWRIPGTGEPDGLLSMGSHRVRHDWSDLAAAAAEKQMRRFCIVGRRWSWHAPGWWQQKWAEGLFWSQCCGTYWWVNLGGKGQGGINAGWFFINYWVLNVSDNLIHHISSNSWFTEGNWWWMKESMLWWALAQMTSLKTVYIY